MAKQILRDQKVWLGEYDLTGVMSALSLEYGAEMQDNTAFGQNTRTKEGGLKTVAASHQGFFDAALADAPLFANMGVADVPMSIGAAGGAEGDRAFTFKANEAEYAPGGSVGDMLRFSLNAEATGDLIRGTLMHNAARTATANGTAQQLGAASASQRIYAALHVTAASGTTPTLDVVVESDNDAGFASPVTRLTFAQKTAIGFEWLELAGAVTDDWWRITFTIGGTTPNFTFGLVLGVQ